MERGLDGGASEGRVGLGLTVGGGGGVEDGGWGGERARVSYVRIVYRSDRSPTTMSNKG